MLQHVAPRREGCTDEEQLTVITRSMKYIDFVAQPYIYSMNKFVFVFIRLLINKTDNFQ